MNVAAGPFTIAALLLVVAGASKMIAPGDTSTAVRGLGISLGPMAVRVGAAAEASIGVYAAIAGDRFSGALVACSYLAFATFVAVALARHLPIATCGCFGKADTPPSAAHVGLNLAAAAAAIAVIADPGVGLPDAVARQPLNGVPYLLLVAAGSVLAFASLIVLPRAPVRGS